VVADCYALGASRCAGMERRRRVRPTHARKTGPREALRFTTHALSARYGQRHASHNRWRHSGLQVDAAIRKVARVRIRQESRQNKCAAEKRADRERAHNPTLTACARDTRIIVRNTKPSWHEAGAFRAFFIGADLLQRLRLELVSASTTTVDVERSVTRNSSERHASKHGDGVLAGRRGTGRSI